MNLQTELLVDDLHGFKLGFGVPKWAAFSALLLVLRWISFIGLGWLFLDDQIWTYTGLLVEIAAAKPRDCSPVGNSLLLFFLYVYGR